MIKLSSQKAINTKIKTMNSNFISNDQLKTILNSPTLDEAISYIKNIMEFNDTSYNVENLLDLEFLISKKHYLTIESLDIYKSFKTKYLNEDIKLLINVVLKNISIEDSKKYLYVLGKNNIPIPKTDNISNFVDYFKDTEYYDVLKQYEYNTYTDVSFATEIGLDNLYYKKILSTLHYIDSNSKKSSINILKTRVDFLNLEWIYRGKKFYKLIPEEMINYCNLHGHLSFNQIKSFCYMSEEEYLLYLNKHYPALLENGIEYMWVNTGKILFNMATHIIIQNPNDELLIHALIFALEFKVKDLYMVLESKRLDFTNDEIKKMLITLN